MNMRTTFYLILKHWQTGREAKHPLAKEQAKRECLVVQLGQHPRQPL